MNDGYNERVSFGNLGTSLHDVSISTTGGTRRNRSSLTNLQPSNKAVAAALKGLQDKIKQLENERDMYKQQFESQKKELEALIQCQKQMKEEYQSVKEKLIKLESDKEYYKKLAQKNEEIQTTKSIASMNVRELGSRIEELTKENASVNIAMKELQNQIDEERKKRDSVEAKKNNLEKAMKELLKLHKSVIEKESKKPQKKKETASSRSRTKKRILYAAPSKSSKNIHERFKRANKHQDIPFVLGKAKGTHNVYSTAQKNLSVGTSIAKNEDDFGELLSEIDPDKDIDKVMKELEEEYEQLRMKYNKTLSKIDEKLEETDPKMLHLLRDYTERMERKNKQLKYLRKCQQHFAALTSPPKVKGFRKRAKTLRLFRTLKNLTS